MFTRRKGIALILVIMVIFISTGLMFLIYSASSQDRQKIVLKKEKLRAEMLAKGAVQHALLKIRYFPTEFYDACLLSSVAHGDENGIRKIADKTIDYIDESYLGEWKRDEDGGFSCSGEFIRDLSLMMSDDIDEGFNDEELYLGQIKTKSPYGGVYFVNSIELLSHDNSHKGDTVKITVYAKEISGFTTGVLQGSVKGTKSEVNLNEGLTYTVIKELKWK
ncbi:MAG: hypothetical protein M0R46_00635 [Candidatus Muirbacterium halophilum]|nr:hypothetical protein [Candidatus Muirbacterium halophilum]MCK9474400.1 hypothetical protein [Candidatus Muirbacterium halophilum]